MAWTSPARNGLQGMLLKQAAAAMLKTDTRQAGDQVTGAGASPSRLPSLHGCLVQAGEHVAVKALELPHAGEAPAPIPLWVGGVPQLPSWPHAHRELCDDGACTASGPQPKPVACPKALHTDDARHNS